MRPLSSSQIKEVKFMFDSQNLRELAEENPDDIICWVGNEQYLITDSMDFDNSFEDAKEFFKWRLRANRNSIDSLAKELGYSGLPNCTSWDFLEDFDFTDNDILEEKIIENYDGERLGDWLYE